MPELHHELDEAVSFVRAYRNFSSALSTSAKPFGLTADTCLLLLVLRDKEGISNTEIAETLGLNLATATKIIDRMVSDNLVHRKPHATDRRRIQLLLTSDGATVAQKASATFIRFMKNAGPAKPR